MNNVGGLGTIGAHATVIRPKHNYYHLFGRKLSDLPWAENGAAYWMDRGDQRLGLVELADVQKRGDATHRAKTPREAIEAGEGAKVEELIDELEHMRAAEVALTGAIERFNALPIFAAAIAGLAAELQKITPNLPWNAFNEGHEWQ